MTKKNSFTHTEGIVKRYAHQIEYLNSFGEAGHDLLQSYRQAKVLAVGTGPFLVSLAAALFESGLCKFHVFITDSSATDRNDLKKLTDKARQSDPEASIDEITFPKKTKDIWSQAVQPFQWILYVSEEGNIEELQALHAACRTEKKPLLPALCLHQAGVAGPFVHPDNEGCWESARRRIHRSSLIKEMNEHTFSATAGTMLANVIVFELLKTVTRVTESELNNSFYLLDLQTFEGSFHSFLPHPLLTGCIDFELIDGLELKPGQKQGGYDTEALFSYFSRLTSKESGIFDHWDEGDLKQLPLCQCRVQAADPLSPGPAELLPEIICTGLTHMEASIEAGLSGIEAYTSRLAQLFVTKPISGQTSTRTCLEWHDFIAIGAGKTVEQAICRGLQKCLTEELRKQVPGRIPAVFRVTLNRVEDLQSRYYLQVLTTLKGMPEFGLGEEIFGFPVVWVGTDDCWYGCVGLNKTLALRGALETALVKAQNDFPCLSARGIVNPCLEPQEKMPLNLVIQTSDENSHHELLQMAMQVLARNNRRLVVFNMALEPFLEQELGGVFGVVLRKGESR